MTKVFVDDDEASTVYPLCTQLTNADTHRQGYSLSCRAWTYCVFNVLTI